MKQGCACRADEHTAVYGWGTRMNKHYRNLHSNLAQSHPFLRTWRSLQTFPRGRVRAVLDAVVKAVLLAYNVQYFVLTFFSSVFSHESSSLRFSRSWLIPSSTLILRRKRSSAANLFFGLNLHILARGVLPASVIHVAVNSQ